LHLDKLKYDILQIYTTLFDKILEYKVSLPRFKFKEYILDSIDGTELEGHDNIKLTSKEHKFNNNTNNYNTNSNINSPIVKVND